MNTKLLLDNLSKHVRLSRTEESLIVNLISEEKVKRNEFLIQQGEACPYIYFVNAGTLRAYFINAQGKESTIMFAIADWWITDMYCFLNRLPAIVSVQAVEKSEVLRLSKNDLDKLLNEAPSFNTFFRILMQNAYCREQLRMIQNLSIPAIDRYQNFIQKYPLIANQIPLKHIASYLGVTPEFLSTARSKKNEN